MTTTATTRNASGPSAATLIRWSGAAAIAAGLIFAGIQPIHPADVLASVTTGPWALIIALKFVMCLLFLLGIAGLFARQIGRAGWVGFAGFALLTVSWWLQTGFVFIDGFVLPSLAGPAPQFVESFLGMVNPASPVTMDIGVLPVAYGAVGICYMLGGLLFGIAIFRAGVLPRWAGALLAVTAVLTPLAVLLPHEIQRLAAVPMGLAFIWLGYALWSGRRAPAAQAAQAVA